MTQEDEWLWGSGCILEFYVLNDMASESLGCRWS